MDGLTLSGIIEKSMKENISTQVENGIHPSGGLQIDWSNPGGTTKRKKDKKVRKEIDPVKNCISDQNAPEKKNYFPWKTNSALNMKSQ